MARTCVVRLSSVKDRQGAAQESALGGDVWSQSDGQQQHRGLLGPWRVKAHGCVQLLATSSALSTSKVLSSPPRARQIFTVRSLKGKKKNKMHTDALNSFKRP